MTFFRKGISSFAVVAIVALVFIGFQAMGKYNSFVSLDETVQTSWSEIENQLQRRYDLIPNLVETVKGAANFQQDTLEAVVSARAQATQMTVDISDAESMRQFQNVQSELSSALARLLAVSESYPELKTEAFDNLQVQLEGTENRLAVARNRYNETVQSLNTSIRVFPGNLYAKIFGFNSAERFQIEDDARQTPQVDFSL